MKQKKNENMPVVVVGGEILFHIHMLNSPLLILAVLSEECCFFVFFYLKITLNPLPTRIFF